MEDGGYIDVLIVISIYVVVLKVIERLRARRENQENQQEYLAMYSSVFGGITTDPAAMVIPIDDHMVHRGHGVFDTAAIVDGYVRILYSSRRLRCQFNPRHA